ncbi:MAG: class I SAM-dependent methyltransferase [Solirubrobacteraceae bacterium]
MKPGQASRTAELVCMGRAAAQRRTSVVGFDDPTALELLPEEARVRVERFRAGTPPRGIRQRLEQAHLKGLAEMMALRTVAIDNAIRSAAGSQLVILGAGLDGRAWRMPNLREATVFEVDHPASQREKLGRVSRLKQTARDVRFVSVDFERDLLDEKLAAAGHDPASATTWVWEGVVMYLTRADIERTLAVIRSRSAHGSRLVIVYQRPGVVRDLAALFLRRAGEPLRSAFTPAAMGALLGAYGFSVASDEDLATLGASLSANPNASNGLAQRFSPLRIAVADRASNEA